MLTIGHYKDAQGVKDYFKEHLEKGDYYSERGHVQGKWVGKMAHELGLEAKNRVSEEDFGRLADGLHPGTGKKLAVRTKKDRIVSYDMVFSAPKTISIMALTLQDARLMAAHEWAIGVAFEQMEKKAMTRVRRGLSIKSRESRPTGNLIAARFTHTSSREMDPQLHTHHLVFNVTFDPVEKRTKALDAYQIWLYPEFPTAV
jgi:conjugative relaxase-like TrwC/TraI family protein